MKAKILFVDDEVFVLDGLKRSLRAMRQSWDMYFVSSGQEAFDFLAKTRCDIVVSDMRMPGMNGAEVMDGVKKLYPNTMRFILTGHSDQELILQCIKSTHQFLSKPCTLDELKSKLSGALRGSVAENQTVSSLISKMEPLPSVPALYFEIIEAIRNPTVSLEEIGVIVGGDVAMTANILKMANSSYFGTGREICSIVEATKYLGVDSIRSLVLVAGAFSQFDRGGTATSEMQQIWDHSLATAALSKTICQLETGSEGLSQECFVAGMLHDIGKLGMASHFPQQYEQVNLECEKMGIKAVEAERLVFQTDHPEIGSSLFCRWGLPQALIDAIAFHHEPRKCLSQEITVLTFVHVANALVHQRTPEDARLYTGAIDLDYLEALGLSSRLNRWRSTCVGRPKLSL